MATLKRLNDGDGGGDSYTSLQKHAAEQEEEEEPMKTTKNKKKKKTKRIWNEDDELAILKGLVDYRVKTRHEPNFDWDGFFNFVRGSVHVKFSKEQLFSKIRKLRRKFLVNMDRINQGQDPLFTRSTDSQAFGYSNMIWGQDEAVDVANGRRTEKAEIANGRSMEKDEVADGRNMEKDEVTNGRSMEEAEIANGRSMEEAEIANGRSLEEAMQIENGEDAFKEDKRVANEEHVNGNGAKKKRKFDGESLHDKTTHGKESHEDDDDDDLCVVEEAFETMVLRGLSGYQKKLQLEKLRNLGTGKIKDLSNEWKSLCAEEVKLNIKKLRFSLKLVEAANDGAV